MMQKLRQIFAGDAAIDFRSKWPRTLTVSGLLLVGSLTLLLTRGLNLSIDFEGGGVWEAPVPEGVTVADARDVLGFVPDVKIQLLGGADSGSVIRVQAGTAALDDEAEISAALAELAGGTTDDVNTSTIGPTWGDQITSKAVAALGWFFVAVAAYLAWRLEWRMAVGALAAVVHDLLITAGVYALFGFEVSPATLIALLTILGYSLYDTVVVFDKVLENEEGPLGEALDYPDLVNQSMNQVLMRSINTTITTVLPVLSMLIIGGVFLGGASLREFALALFVGLILGTFSSIFVAAPILLYMRQLAPDARRAASIEARRQGRAKGDRPDTQFIEDRDASLLTPGGAAPRPRKKGRRR